MTKNTNKILPKNAYNFECDYCDFKCSKESNWKNHILTRKHKIRTNTMEALNKNANGYVCSCGKVYKHSSSLWNHKKKCSTNQEKTTNIIVNDESDTKSTTGVEIDKELLIKMLLKNQEVIEKMMELIPTMGNVSHNSE